MIAITLFSLKENAIKEKYKKWTLESVRPRMIMMDSVKGFIDYSVVGLLNHSGTKYDFIEIIEITNQKEFEEDNSQGLGLEIATEWNDWVDDYSIIFCEHIN
jgi:hypothetical protein|tara:strand:- start:141 stop:446 length:306 start_codon:yes stop_codon:yes gene_type:complete